VRNLIENSVKLKDVCSALDVAVFKDFEIKFLQEFIECMQPVADALDRLQGDQHCFMADLIPTLLRTRDKLQSMSAKPLAYCLPLCTGLLKSLKHRFNDYMCLHEHVDEYILAAVTDPYFKLRWVPWVTRVQELLLSRAAAQMKNVTGSAT